MIKLQTYLEGLKKNIARVREYSLGMDGTGGKCDCIGLIIGAIRLAGGKWNGTHGSNYAARNEMDGLSEILGVEMLEVGDVVYKAYSPGQANYDMPEKYRNSGDLNDYYHVGVVTKVNPLEITHCTSVSGGIKKDKSLGAWKYFGVLKCVDYSADNSTQTEDDKMEEYVNVSDGKLNLREGPGSNYKTLIQIPAGGKMLCQEAGEEKWLYCDYMNVTGWVMRKYAQPVNGEVTITMSIGTAQALYATLGVALHKEA